MGFILGSDVGNFVGLLLGGRDKVGRNDGDCVRVGLVDSVGFELVRDGLEDGDPVGEQDFSTHSKLYAAPEFKPAKPLKGAPTTTLFPSEERSIDAPKKWLLPIAFISSPNFTQSLLK